MRKFAIFAVLFTATSVLCAAGDTPRSRNPAVRLALQELEAAQNKARIVLQRALSDARARGDKEEAELLLANLEAIGSSGTVVAGTASRIERALTGTRWRKGDVWIELLPDGLIASSYNRTAGVWHVRNDGSVIIAHGQAVVPDIRVYRFDRDGKEAVEQRLASGATANWERVD